MADDRITTDELRAMFGEAVPMEAMRVLFPELCDGGTADPRPVAEVRADVVACALRLRDARGRG